MNYTYLKIKPYTLLVCMLCTIFTTLAQQTNKPGSVNPPAKDNTCGCSYFPMCNWEETKIFAGKTFKGYSNEDGNMEWYHCENGVVTVKWIETVYPESSYSTYNPFDNKTTIHTYSGPGEQVTQTRIILKYNLQEGGTWSQEVTEHNGLINTYHWKIIKRGMSYEHNGNTYTDVIKVKHWNAAAESLGKIGDMFGIVGGEYYYFAKGVGLVNVERETSDQRMDEKIKETEKRLKAQGQMITGTLDQELVGMWRLPGSVPGEAATIMELHEDGTGALYEEVTGANKDDKIFEDIKGMFQGKESTGKTYFFWRINNGLLFLFLDSDLEKKNEKLYPYSRVMDKKTNRPAIRVAKDDYVAVNKTKWQSPIEVPVATVTMSKTLKGVIDPSILGSWKYMINLGGGFFQPAIYTFKQDGTYEYYIPNAMSTTDQSKNKFNGYWRIDGDFIELLANSQDKIERKRFRKINDPKTGKPKIVIQHDVTQDREYETQDNKKPW